MTSGLGLGKHDAMAEYQQNALDNALVNLERGRSTVFDRHWPSDYCYGQVLRGRPSCDCKKMRDQFAAVDAVYVFAMTPNVVANHAAEKDPDHPYDDAIFTKVVERYQELLQSEMLIGQIVIHYDIELFRNRSFVYDGFVTKIASLAL